MIKIYEQLKSRFGKMSELSRELGALEISNSLCQKFHDVVGKAIVLNSKLINSTDWDSEMKYDISMYLLFCEECLDDAGSELPRLHCEMRSQKVLFSNERLLIMSFLYGKLHDSMFI